MFEIPKRIIEYEVISNTRIKDFDIIKNKVLQGETAFEDTGLDSGFMFQTAKKYIRLVNENKLNKYLKVMKIVRSNFYKKLTIELEEKLEISKINFINYIKSINNF